MALAQVLWQLGANPCLKDYLPHVQDVYVRLSAKNGRREVSLLDVYHCLERTLPETMFKVRLLYTLYPLTRLPITTNDVFVFMSGGLFA